MERIGRRLARLYGEERRERLLERVSLLAGRYGVGMCPDDSCKGPLWSERDAVLITYGDMIQRAGEPPLFALHRFLEHHLKGAVSGVHILPFFPYSSDDGFSVIDFRKVDPRLGNWDDVEAIAEEYRLMVDLVLNHVSSLSDWFRAYANGIAPERDYFIELANCFAPRHTQDRGIHENVLPSGEHSVETSTKLKQRCYPPPCHDASPRRQCVARQELEQC